MTIKSILSIVIITISVFVLNPAHANPPKTENGVTTIHLDEYNGYFAARETLVSLKPGTYEFVVTNKADKLVGFWLQDGKSHAMLEQAPLEPGQVLSTRVQIGENGFRR